VSFNNTLKEGNECSDWLAKFGATNVDSLKMWMHVPRELDITLLADTFEVFRQRVT